MKHQCKNGQVTIFSAIFIAKFPVIFSQLHCFQGYVEVDYWFRVGMLKYSNKYPKQYLLGDSPRKREMSPHAVREISDSGGVRTHDLWNRSPLR